MALVDGACIVVLTVASPHKVSQEARSEQVNRYKRTTANIGQPRFAVATGEQM